MAASIYRQRIDSLNNGYHFQVGVSKQSESDIHLAIPYLRRYPFCSYKDTYDWRVTVDFGREDTVLGSVETIQIFATPLELEVILPEVPGVPGQDLVPYGEMDVTVLLRPGDIDKVLDIMAKNHDIGQNDDVCDVAETKVKDA